MLLNRLLRLSPPAILLAVLLPACGRFDSGASSPPDSDPALCRPTPRELRQARAEAWAEREMESDGGLIRYAADGSSSRPGGVGFPAARNVLTLGIRADLRLNSDGGVPHALDLAVYHLRQPTHLNRLFRLENGEQRLPPAGFPGEADDFYEIGSGPSLPDYSREYLGAYVVGVERFSLQPGQNAILSLSRPEGGRYVALVAGYHRRDDSRANVLQVSEYPVGKYEQREKGGHFYRRTAMFRPLPLNLEVELGPDAMRVYAAGRLQHPLRDVETASALRPR